ncbi:prolyl oligopeptidase family serine peptidase [Corynebacterium vitaeruminis]|uniref:prolyl oligopeptidase family serine peptidase n=1 Tax=Corynebacterium vitaeruminis TaxID=38305 RepID=UPI00054F3775
MGKVSTPDEFLLDIDDPRALDWAAAWSSETARFRDEALRERIEAGLNTDARIAYVTRRGEYLYNFWRDEANPRGLWRRTTLDNYRLIQSGSLAAAGWQVLVDVDALAREDGENWVWKGAHVRPHHFDRALVRLSRGGADAVVIKEFDLERGEFVAAFPFAVEEAKTQVSWVDRDTILVCTDFGGGSLTTSGYPARAHLWYRGEDLQASEEFFSGNSDDLVISAWAQTDPGYEHLFARRTLDFYRSHTFVLTDNGLQILELPEDAQIVVHKNWMFLIPRTPWAGIAAGGLGVIDFDAFLGGARGFTAVFTPSATTSLQDLSTTAGHLVMTILDNVASTIVTVPLGDLGGKHTPLPLPELTTCRVVAADDDSEELWLGASSFTQPDTLYRLELGEEAGPDAKPSEVMATASALFEATGLSTRQHWATSADGTKIPYFITGHFGDSLEEGYAGEPRPTLVNAYGGFEVSLMPSYSFVRGIWLERGFFHVQANLRGGGEFGPAWHESVILGNRMRIYEDHQAVLRDLVARGYTTPRQLVVRGGSNGGLLTSVALTRYPELIGAAVIQVPLTDMLRYHTWSAGASWMAEYGDPEGPEREALLEYSPLRNIALNPQVAATSPTSLVDGVPPAPRSESYPPALVTTSTRDDRVHPAHARLFALALKRAGQPVDYFENSEGGHAGAADNAQTAAMEALVYGWLFAHLA